MSSRNAPLGIVVGIDDSPAARVALQWATRDAELRKIPLTLVHAVSPEVSTWLTTPLPAGVMRWQQDHGRRLVDEGLKLVEEGSSAWRSRRCPHRNLGVRSRPYVDQLVQRRRDAGRWVARQWALAWPAPGFG